jgi:hypothetical protein
MTSTSVNPRRGRAEPSGTLRPVGRTPDPDVILIVAPRLNTAPPDDTTHRALECELPTEGHSTAGGTEKKARPATAGPADDAPCAGACQLFATERPGREAYLPGMEVDTRTSRCEGGPIAPVL